VRLNREPVEEYLRSNCALLNWMIAEGYGDARTLQRRIDSMKAWLAAPILLEPDADAEYHTVIEIDLDTLHEPLLCCPNDPDDVKPLSAVAGDRVDEVFLGSCMTNIGHFRAAGKILEQADRAVPGRLWIVPPTRMDQAELTAEGLYGTYGKVGARTEVPGCSLCMGNQARVADNATVVSTSTRNFPNRMGSGANVYLASAEVSAVCSVLGRIPTLAEYRQHAGLLEIKPEDTYRYLNFDQMTDYQTRSAA
jgi:aconitate hydratase 2/2-methylisocitrate dehydratase